MEENKVFNLATLVSLIVGVISLIVIIPTISMIMEKDKPTVTYQVIDTIILDDFTPEDFTMTTTTTSSGQMEVFTYQADNFTFIVNDMNGVSGELPSFTQTELINGQYYPYILFAKTTNLKDIYYLTNDGFRYIPKNTGTYQGNDYSLLRFLSISDFKIIQFD